MICTGLAAVTVSAAPPDRGAERIIVQPLGPGKSALLERFHLKNGHKLWKRFEAFGDIQVIEIPRHKGLGEAVREYRESGLVAFAEPDYQVHISAIPNDPAYENGMLWGLNHFEQNGTAGAGIDAENAWQSHTSAEAIIVAVIDTGIRSTHEDLAANMWRNPGEIQNGRDDDGNGIVDDIHGINAVDGTGNSEDDNGHGTHIAGTIGAVGNNGKGVVGVCWRVELMACKALNAEGAGATSDTIEAIQYALSKGAKVINASWGGPSYSVALQHAISKARLSGAIVIAAAGNERLNNDVYPTYPANYPLDNVVSVAGSNRSDVLDLNYSNYGASTVDLAAPGTAIYSTWHTSNTAYKTVSGTSMAAPHVAGAIALYWGAHPGEPYRSVIAKVLGAVDKSQNFVGKCVTEGRLSVGNLFPAPVVKEAREIRAIEVTGAGLVRLTVGPVSDDTSIWVESSTDRLTWSVVQPVSVESTDMGVVVTLQAAKRHEFYRVASS